MTRAPWPGSPFSPIRRLAGAALLLLALVPGCGGGGRALPALPTPPAGEGDASVDEGPEDFLDVLRWTGPLHRWRATPVTVAVLDEGAPAGYYAAMKEDAARAAERWNAAGVIPIRVVDPAAGEAMVTVRFYEGRVVDGYAYYGDAKAIHGGDGGITHVDVLLSVNVPGPMYPLALHELGHAFGIWGHSPYESDIMFGEYRPNRTDLTRRDVSTLRRVYEVK